MLKPAAHLLKKQMAEEDMEIMETWCIRKKCLDMLRLKEQKNTQICFVLLVSQRVSINKQPVML